MAAVHWETSELFVGEWVGVWLVSVVGDGVGEGRLASGVGVPGGSVDMVLSLFCGLVGDGVGVTLVSC